MHIAMGGPVYADDLAPADCLVIKLLRSPYPSAAVSSIDVAAARKMEGVAAVYTWEDTQIQCTTGFDYCKYDHTLLTRVARYQGDPVAMVVAEDLKTAERAIARIRVKWEVYEPLTDPEEALDSEKVVHGDQLGKIIRHGELKDPETDYHPERNQIARVKYDFDDVDAAFAESEVVVETRITTQQQAHAMLESHRTFAYIDRRDKLVIVGSLQSSFAVQRTVAVALGIDSREIIVTKAQVGGGFGGKDMIIPELFTAFATYRLRRPTKIIFTRQESLADTGTRHATIFDMKMGADKEGNITGIDSTLIMDGGAYSDYSFDVILTGIFNAYPLFPRTKAMRFNHLGVMTNKVLGCPLRGMGATQNLFALNRAISQISGKLDMDISEIFLKNIGMEGDTHPLLNGNLPEDPRVINSSSLSRCITRAKELIDWDTTYRKQKNNGNIVRGIGMSVASHASSVARDDRGAVNVTFNSDGSFTVFTGHADIGTGSDTGIIQIVAEVLQMPMKYIHIKAACTDTSPHDNGTYASSNIYRTGGAAKKAAEKMKGMLIENGRRLMGLPDEAEIEYGEKGFYAPATKEFLSIPDFARKMVSYWHGREQLVASESFACDVAPSPYIACVAEVEVDKMTGTVNLLQCISVVDCGTVINSNLARVQVDGGTAQSIGMCLYERFPYVSDGRLAKTNFQSYKIPSQMDIPKIRTELLPSFEHTGPFGAKGIGEIAANAAAPAIADAVFNATGVHVNSLPITPEKMFRALWESEKGSVLS